jgi:hypothetical protein
MPSRQPQIPAQTPPESAEDVPTISAEQLGKRVGRSRSWVLLMARQGAIPHVRVGRPPLPNKKDTRPVYFTTAQADAVEAFVHHVEYRPAGGAA